MNITTILPQTLLARPGRHEAGDGSVWQQHTLPPAPSMVVRKRNLGDRSEVQGSTLSGKNILEPSEIFPLSEDPVNMRNLSNRSSPLPEQIIPTQWENPFDTPTENIRQNERTTSISNLEIDYNTEDIEYELNELELASVHIGSSPTSYIQNNRQTNDYLPNLTESNNLNTEKENFEQKIGKKQGFTIASLNIKGKTYKNGESKYRNIQTLLRTNRIALLAIQESRLTDNEIESIENAYPKLKIWNSGNSTAKEGVAFILNKDQLNESQISNFKEIKTGFAAQITIQRNESEKYTLVNVHTPNDAIQKEQFLREINQIDFKDQELGTLIVLGDWNMTEGIIDRLPHRTDNVKIMEAFEQFKTKNQLIDGWRENNQEKKEYTYTQNWINQETLEKCSSFARIDRIYIDKDNYKYTGLWNIMNQGEISDHKIVTVELLSKTQPFQ